MLVASLLRMVDYRWRVVEYCRHVNQYIVTNGLKFTRNIVLDTSYLNAAVLKTRDYGFRCYSLSLSSIHY